VNLGAVQAHRAQFEELHLAREFEDLHEYVGQFVEESATESGERVVVGVEAGGEIAEGDGVVGGAFDPAAGEVAGGVAIDQEAEHDFGVVGGTAAACVGPGQLAEVQFFHGFYDEACQVIFR
jgi:hypothetical protein